MANPAGPVRDRGKLTGDGQPRRWAARHHRAAVARHDGAPYLKDDWFRDWGALQQLTPFYPQCPTGAAGSRFGDAQRTVEPGAAPPLGPATDAVVAAVSRIRRSVGARSTMAPPRRRRPAGTGSASARRGERVRPAKESDGQPGRPDQVHQQHQVQPEGGDLVGVNRTPRSGSASRSASARRPRARDDQDQLEPVEEARRQRADRGRRSSRAAGPGPARGSGPSGSAGRGRRR